MPQAETASLKIKIDLSGNATTGIGKLQRQVNGLGSSIGRVGKGVGQIGAGFARAGLLVGGAAVAGLTAAAKAGIDFEDAFAGVRKTINETDLAKAGLSFEQLSTAFRKMATDIPISAVQFAQLGETAGALGVKAQDIEEFVRVTALMGVTTNLSADQAADAFGRIGTILGLTGDDYEELADSIVALGNAGASTEAEITEITQRFAAEAKAAGLSKEQIVGLASATASLGFAPERGGTALARVFANLSTNIATANDKGKAISKAIGRPIKDLQRDLDRGKGLGIFQDVLETIRDMSPTQAARFLKSIGITNVSDRTIFRTMADQLPFVNEQLEIARTNTGALLKEAEKKFATTASKIQLFKNNIVEAGITLSEGFLPAVGRSLDKLTAAFKDPGNKAEIKKLGEDIGAALDDIDWDQVVRGAKDFVGVLKSTLSITLDILNAINKLPTEVKAAAAALLVLNKASGGLIGAGAGNVVGGLAETAIRGAGSRLPKVGALFAQPVFVTNWPIGGIGGGGAGGKGGGLGGVVGILGLAGLITAAVDAGVQTVNQKTGSSFVTSTPVVGNPVLTAQNIMQGFILAWKTLNPQRPVVSAVDGSTAAIERSRAGMIATFQQTHTDSSDKQTNAIEKVRQRFEVAQHDSTNKQNAAIEHVRVGISDAITHTGTETKSAVVSGAAAQGALLAVQTARLSQTSAAEQGTVRTSVGGAASRITSAIRANRPITNVSVHVNATTVSKSVTVVSRYGPTGGSSDSNSRYGPQPT